MNRNRTAAATTLAAALAVTLLGCTGTPASTSSTSPATTTAPRPVTMAGARNCPVTIGHPVPSSKPWREGLFGWQRAYGNGSLSGSARYGRTESSSSPRTTSTRTAGSR